MHGCRLRSEAKVDSRHPVAHLGLREEVGRGEVAAALPTLPEAVHLGVDPTVVVDGQEIPSAERQARAVSVQRPGDVVRSVEGE